jgi:(p)ppGpp synthase/HD superfamily hydrolase
MTDHPSRFGQALAYAELAHAGQLRKGTTVPYVAHLLGVAALALEHGADEDEAIAALLHDTVEDCGGLDRLPWKERKQTYIHDLLAAPPSVLLVVACDKLHNVRSLILALQHQADDAWQIFKGGKNGTLWYYRAVYNVLDRRGVRPILLGDLKASIEEAHRLAGSQVPLSQVDFPEN